MSRFRLRHVRARIVLLAIAALVWSQLVLAGHVDCAVERGQDQAPRAGVMEHECGARDARAGTICASHCSQGDASSGEQRVPPVPLLASPGLPRIAVAAIARVPGGARLRFDTQPPRSWNRPTAHPAALLLL